MYGPDSWKSSPASPLAASAASPATVTRSSSAPTTTCCQTAAWDAEHEIVPVVIVGLPTAFYMAKKVVAVVLWLILIYGALAVITGIVLVSCTRILDSVV